MFVTTSYSQTSVNIDFYKKRFDSYLNFNNSITNKISFTNKGVELKNNSAVTEYIIYWDEIKVFNNLVKSTNMDSFVKIIKLKGVNRFTNKQISQANKKEYKPFNATKLKGVKVAIDAGHISYNMNSARIEQKYIHFCKDSVPDLQEDSVNIAEGILTFKTASILKNMLEKEGADVFMTRSKIENSSFGISYEEWFLQRRKKVLDSLKIIKKISIAQHSKFLKMDRKKLFWEFFKDYELNQRAKQINLFKPDLSIIIHYNVDEKNVPWVRPSSKNYSMCFIPGAFTENDFNKIENKINLLRLLLTEDLSTSERLAGRVAETFQEQLKVPMAWPIEADYFSKACKTTATEGVYCRGLALCKNINSPLVYGECLYQDNKDEFVILSKSDEVFEGVRTNKRVYQVAKCYFDAIHQLLQK